MNKKQLSQLAIPLEVFNPEKNQKDRDFIESEKKYYQVINSLKTNRKKLGLSQNQLSNLAHIPRTTITKIESGSRNVTLETLMTLAHAMGKKIELRLV